MELAFGGDGVGFGRERAEAGGGGRAAIGVNEVREERRWEDDVALAGWERDGSRAVAGWDGGSEARGGDAKVIELWTDSQRTGVARSDVSSPSAGYSDRTTSPNVGAPRKIE